MDIQQVEDFTKKQLANERTGHDFYHGQRVANLATKMYLQDNPAAHQDSRMVAIIRTGSFLHDTIDEKICPNPEKVIAQIKDLLPSVGFSELEIADILFTIQHM